MKVVIVLCVVLGASFSTPIGKSAYHGYYGPAAYHAAYGPARAYYTGPVVTGNLHHTQDSYGQYKFGYASSDGQAKTESRGGDGSVAGSYSYTSPEGQHIKLSYKADKDGGFQAYGDHLPEAPGPLDVPAYLAEAYSEAHGRLAQAYDEARYRGPASSYDDGSYDKYAALYDDGSYKPGLARYQSVALTAPATYHSTYSTSVAHPGKIFYGGAAAPIRASAAHSAVSYSANIGGTAASALAAPAALVAATVPAGHAKSAYAYHG